MGRSYGQTQVKALSEIVEHILGLIAKNPNPCFAAMKKMISTASGMERLAVFFAMIGYESSKRAFSWISEVEWMLLENRCREAGVNISTAEANRILRNVFLELLTETLASNPPRFDITGKKLTPPPPPLKRPHLSPRDEAADMEFRLLDFLRKESPDVYQNLFDNKLIDRRFVNPS